MNGPQQSARLRPFRPIPFGRYTLLSPLATGGMGEIYLARFEGPNGFEKTCVIKKILSALAQDPLFVERFVGEAKTLVRLSHGSVAQVLDMGLHEDEPYIALEFVDGKDLRKVAARQRDRSIPLPLTFVLFVMSRVLDALAYAHRKRDDNDKEINLVHRDVSPQNILISYEGEVKVIDFGLAKSALSSAKTNPSMILGKFLYMSPEQARHQKVDRRSDLYSVGICLYELISGRNPFDGLAPGEIMSKVANPIIPSLQEVDPLCPQSVVDVVMRALHQDPQRRFQTAEEMRGKLLSALVEIDPTAGPESVSRYMRDAFSGEYQAERKLLATLSQAKTIRLSNDTVQPVKAGDVDTAVVHLKDVAPSVAAAMGLSDTSVEPQRAHRPSGPIELAPLSFAPTARVKEVGEERPEGETVPGVSLDEPTRPGASVPKPPSQAPLVNPAPGTRDWEAPDSIFDGVPKVSADSTPIPVIDTNFEGQLLPGDGTSRTNPGLPPTIEVSPEAVADPSVTVQETDTPTGAGRPSLMSDTQPRVSIPAGVFAETVPRVVLGTLIEDGAAPTPAGAQPGPSTLPPSATPTGAQRPSVAADTQPRARMVGRRATVEASVADTGPTRLPATLGAPKKQGSGLKVALLGVGILVLLAGVTVVILPLLAGDVLPFKVPWAAEAKPEVNPNALPELRPLGPPRLNNGPRETPKPVVAPVGERAVDAGVAVAAVEVSNEGVDIEGLLGEDPLAPVSDKTVAKKAVKKPPPSKKMKQLTAEWQKTRSQFEFVTTRVPCETKAMGITCAKYRELKSAVEEASTDVEIDRALKQNRELQNRLADQKKRLP